MPDIRRICFYKMKQISVCNRLAWKISAQIIEKYWDIWEVKTLYSWCKEKNYAISMIDDRTVREDILNASKPENYESWVYDKKVVRKVSKQYIVKIDEAIVIGMNNGVIKDGYYLDDHVSYDKEGFYSHLPDLFFPGENNTVLANLNNFSQRKVDKGINLLKMWSDNYFHFAIETMSRLYAIEKLDDYRNWPLLLDSCVANDERNLQFIDYINMNKRKIIWIEKNELVYVHKMLQPPIVTWASWDIKTVMKEGRGYIIDNYAGKYLRDTIIKQHIVRKKYDKVYVMRGNARRIINEGEIISFFKSSGFEIFNPNEASFYDELDCFSTANLIVLVAGGANTNLIYCKKEAKIYCILPFESRADCPYNLTQIGGGKIIYEKCYG